LRPIGQDSAAVAPARERPRCRGYTPLFEVLSLRLRSSFWFGTRRVIARSWILSRGYYRVRGAQLIGRPAETVWYFAYGANMHDATFRVRRGIEPLEYCRGCLEGYRLRFNIDGWPKGKAAPANLSRDPVAAVWGVLYRISRRDLMRLDRTEGVPGRGYRHERVQVVTDAGRVLEAVTYIAQGKPEDGKPSLRYLTLLRDGARAHGLPAQYISFLDSVEHAA
jgi:cation transport regulator ChaC